MGTGQTGGVDELTRLAIAAGAGDRVAMAAFVRRTQPEVWRLCARLGDREVADDLTQAGYLRALPALARFRAEASARTWLLQIARHVCADHVRRSTRRRALHERLVRRADPTDATVDDATGEVALDDAVAALQAGRAERWQLRALQRYVVQAPARDVMRWQSRGDAIEPMPGWYVLRDSTQYDPRRGLLREGAVLDTHSLVQ